MKKFLPLILLGVGLLVVVVALFVVKGGKKDVVDEEENVAEIPLEKRPLVKLVPSEDGHWLDLSISEVMVDGAASVDYELLYTKLDGRVQGVPGKVALNGNSIERKLLLGSESSGKYTYDEGIEGGKLSLKFRNESGKLVGKLEGEWVLESNQDEITSSDGKVVVTFASVPEDVFYVLMPVFGMPEAVSENVMAGPYGLFTSDQNETEAEVLIDGGMSKAFVKSWSDYSGILNENGENFFIKI